MADSNNNAQTTAATDVLLPHPDAQTVVQADPAVRCIVTDDEGSSDTEDDPPKTQAYDIEIPMDMYLKCIKTVDTPAVMDAIVTIAFARHRKMINQSEVQKTTRNLIRSLRECRQFMNGEPKKRKKSKQKAASKKSKTCAIPGLPVKGAVS